MKTSHQLARELLALPNIPVYHFDPSRAGMDDESDTSLSIPKAEICDAMHDMTPQEIAEYRADYPDAFTGQFITIVGAGDVSDEPGDFAEKTIGVLLDSHVITRAQVEAAHSHLLAKEEAFT